MVSRHQRGNDTEEYRNTAHKMLETKDKELLLRLKPTQLEQAQTYLGECNRLDVETELKEHFAAEIRRLQNNGEV